MNVCSFDCVGDGVLRDVDTECFFARLLELFSRGVHCCKDRCISDVLHVYVDERCSEHVFWRRLK